MSRKLEESEDFVSKTCSLPEFESFFHSHKKEIDLFEQMNRQQVAIQVALGTSFLLALSLLLNKRKQQIVEIADKVSSTFEKPIDALKRKTRMDLYGISLKHLRNELNFEKTATIHELSKAIREQTLLSFGYRSYAQCLFSNPKTKHFVKPVADIYISYAWGSTWGEILDSLCDAYLKDGSKDDIFVWLDVFNLDQHEMKKQTQSTEEFSELAENLKKSLLHFFGAFAINSKKS